MIHEPGPLPELDTLNRFFWTSGEDGRLRFLRCQACSYWIHPPRPRCPACRSDRVEPTVTGGQASVASFTINHQPWLPGMAVPFVVAIVEFPEQKGLRLMTNLVEVEPSSVQIGMRVDVVFSPQQDVWLPLFRPSETQS